VPQARPIGAARVQCARGEMTAMRPKHDTAAAPAASAGRRRGALHDWLALLMLLAGSVVWPP